MYHDGNKVIEGVGTSASAIEQERILVRLPQFRLGGSGVGGTSPLSSAPAHAKRNPMMGSGAQGRMLVVESLYRTFNSGLGDYSKLAMEHFVRCTQRMLQRGGQGSAKSGLSHHRVHLPAGVLVELLHAAYFSIYNGFQMAGSQMVELIRHRGSALGSPQVLVAANAVRTLVLTSGPSHLPAASISTPNQIAKNLITNASFRAKKISDDIAKVQSDKDEQEAQGGSSSGGGSKAKDPIASNLKALANMTAISEEVVEDILGGGGGGGGGSSGDRTPVKAGHHHHHKEGREGSKTSKDKLKAKLHNLPVTGFKKRLSESESERGGGGGSGSEKERKSDKKKDKDSDGGGGGGIEMKPLAKALEFGKAAAKKSKEKTSSVSSSKASSGFALSSPAAAAAAAASNNDDSSSTDSGSALLAQQHQQQQNGGLQQQQQQQQPLLKNISLPAAAEDDAVAAAPSPSSLGVKSSEAPSESGSAAIESLEQVEALIQQKKLPAETITIHSPESGTTIF